MLVPPQQDRPFYVYLSVGDTSIASVLVQRHDGQERVVFYLSRRMLDAETRCNEYGTIYAISSDFGDRMTTQHLD